MVKISSTAIFLTAILNFGAVSVFCSNAKYWNVLIFTQSWPNGACAQWKADSSKHSCSIPSDKAEWTIHGVWPTLAGTKGPNSCDPFLPFDLDQLSGILPRLKDRWMSVQNVSDSDDLFWSHEWVKHGTCAAELASMSTEYKYFSQGLRLSAEYDMKEVLSEAGIRPSEKPVDPSRVWSGVRAVLGRSPIVACYTSGHESYLMEIRLCFDKSLTLVDCVGLRGSTKGDLIQCSNRDATIYNI